MNVHGGYLRVEMCVVRPKDMVGHGNGAWGDTNSPGGKASGGTVYAKYTTKQHSKTGDADGCGVDGLTHRA